MTVSKATADEIAKKLYDKMSDISDDPFIDTLELVEIIMQVAGNKSFQESMVLLHKAVKDYELTLLKSHEPS